MTKKKDKPQIEAQTIAYKGFDKNLQCRGFQYEVGKTYTHDGPAIACKSGFHSCENPLNVFEYYPPSRSRFAEVVAHGNVAREVGGDTKIAVARITIAAELSMPNFIAKAVTWLVENAKEKAQHSTGDRSAASATGYRSAASATGCGSAASATGCGSAASATGYQSAASATGDRSAASATGCGSAASATGDQSAASATGDRSAASATGYQSAASAEHKKAGAYNTGYMGTVSGIDGAAIHADERTLNGVILSAACGIVGINGIVAGVKYVCRDWKLVPA